MRAKDTNRIVLIGQAPGRLADPSRPLVGGVIGKRLLELTGLTLKEYLRRFERVNVLYKYPGRSGKGDLFPMAEARPRALALARTLKGRCVILLGRNVALAFRVAPTKLFVWSYDFKADFFYAVAPHPSAVNRYWNSTLNVARAEHFFRALPMLDSGLKKFT